jgi:hypothetical protein
MVSYVETDVSELPLVSLVSLLSLLSTPPLHDNFTVMSLSPRVMRWYALVYVNVHVEQSP